MPLGPQAEELAAVLDQLAALLERTGQTRWSELLGNAREKIRAGDASGIDLVLGAYAGADSFRQLTLDSQDDLRVLDNLRRRAHVLADFLKRS